ncbi:MAG TPA: translation initiation factor IF-2 subunit beta [Candidatus Nanoarchaeia archaeon]|nr:translation initiation factor IF-2 subunit beta [Candidatus Nanoarchaeia archaeon]
MDYEKMLEKAKAQLPETTTTKERFEIPKAIGHIQGSKTIISNFNQITSTLRREPAHLLKYLQRELATPASIDGPRLILGRKINSSLINQKIESYTQTFILCKECGKPDTQLKKEEKVLTLKCTVCGAKHPIKTKI